MSNIPFMHPNMETKYSICVPKYDTQMWYLNVVVMSRYVEPKFVAMPLNVIVNIVFM